MTDSHFICPNAVLFNFQLPSQVWAADLSFKLWEKELFHFCLFNFMLRICLQTSGDEGLWLWGPTPLGLTFYRVVHESTWMVEHNLTTAPRTPVKIWAGGDSDRSFYGRENRRIRNSIGLFPEAPVPERRSMSCVSLCQGTRRVWKCLDTLLQWFLNVCTWKQRFLGPTPKSFRYSGMRPKGIDIPHGPK